MHLYISSRGYTALFQAETKWNSDRRSQKHEHNDRNERVKANNEAQLTLIINVSSAIFHSQHLMYKRLHIGWQGNESWIATRVAKKEWKKDGRGKSCESGKIYIEKKEKEEKMRGGKKRITVNLHLESFFPLTFFRLPSPSFLLMVFFPFLFLSQ